MPELPEVETVRRQLEPALVGRTIRRCAVRDPRLTGDAPPEILMRQVQGTRIEALERRGKYLVLRADRGLLVFHLRMTGMLEPFTGIEPERARLVLQLDNETGIAFTDTRRFGTAEWFASDAALDARLTPKLGPEPISADWTVDGLFASLSRRSIPIKSALLDQRVGCGLGNIYADEALFHARINPHRRADSITYREAALLAASCRRVLLDAIDSGGSNVRDYTPPGTVAHYQEQHHAYGRGGMPCRHCKDVMIKTRIGGRATVHCPSCQGSS